MKYPKDFGYMSLIQTVSDVNNAFLSRRELTCDFAGWEVNSKPWKQ